jgi:hypothetical protein
MRNESSIVPYGIHPSSDLVRLFAAKPFQGQDPSKAKVIFLGLDANFAPNIEAEGFFSSIKEYLEDGVTFWENKKVHHPFLLPNYPKGDGVTFHQRFAKLKLNDNRAKDISFVELLDVPTVGKTNYTQLKQLLNRDHLIDLETILRSNSHQKTLLLSKSVYNQLSKVKRDFNVFQWLPKDINTELNKLKLIYEEHYLKVYIMTHFSAAISDKHLIEISSAITADNTALSFRARSG